MAEDRKITELQYRITTRDETSSGTKSAGANLDALQGKAEDVATSFTDMARRAGASTRALSDETASAAATLGKKYTALIREAAALQARIRELEGLRGKMTGALGRGDAQELKQLEAELTSVSQKYEGVQRAIRQVTTAQDAATGRLGELNGIVQGFRDNLQKTALQSNNLFEVTEKGAGSATNALLRMTKSYDALSHKQDALHRAEAQLEKLRGVSALAVEKEYFDPQDADRLVNHQLSRIATLKAEIATIRQMGEASGQQAEKHRKNAESIGLESHQLGILTAQAHKFTDMVVAGGNPLKAAFYEVPNMITVMGGFGKALQLVTHYLAGPIGVALAASAAGIAFYKMGSHAEAEQARLAKLSQQLRATRQDAAQMAGAIDQAALSLQKQRGWEGAAANQAATSIGGTYNFTGGAGDMISLANIARDAGTVFGSLEKGLTAVQTAMTDPVAEIQALYKQHLPGISAQLVDQVKQLQASGEQGKAYAVVINAIRGATKDANDMALTPFQRSMHRLQEAASPLLSVISRLSAALGKDLLDVMTSILSVIPADRASRDGLAGSKLLINASGHVGLGQVDPRYAHGYDISTPSGNIDAALTIFQESLKRAGNSLDKALGYYGGFKDPTSAAARHYAASIYGRNPMDLPTDTRDLIEREAARFNLTDLQTRVFKNVILRESGGHQFTDYRTPVTNQTSHATSAAIIDDQKSLQAGAANAAGGYNAGSLTAQRATIEAFIVAHEKLAQTLTAGSVAWQKNNEELSNARAELANAISPQEKIARGLQDALEPLQSQTGYWRAMAEVVAQFNDAARGTAVNQQALSEALTAKQQALAASYEDGTAASMRQAQSQEAIANAAGKSSAALQHATNFQQAYSEALNDFSEGSRGFEAAVEKRSAALDRLSAAQARSQQLTQNIGIQDNISLMEAQTAAIGQDTQQRQIHLSILQAETQMHRQYGEILPKEAQDYIALTGRLAQTTAAYQQQESALSELTGSISSMADTLSNSVTQALVNASNGGVSFKSVLSGIQSQVLSLIAKLSLVNPLLNGLDGKHRNTLSSVMSLFGEGASAAPESIVGSKTGVSHGNLATYLRSAEHVNHQREGGLFDSVGSFFGRLLGRSHSDVRPAATSLHDVPQAKPTSFLTPLSHAFSGIGGGFSLGSALGNIGGGQYGNMGSIIGATAGTAIGSAIFPGVGTVVGGLLGGAAGGLFGGLFGHRKNPYTIAQVQAGPDGFSVGKVWNQAQTDNITGPLRKDIDRLNTQFARLGIHVGGGYIGAVRDDRNNKDPTLKNVALVDIIKNATLTSGNATFTQALRQGLTGNYGDLNDYMRTITQLKDMAKVVDDLGISVGKFNDDGTVAGANFSKFSGDLRTALDTAIGGRTMSVDDLKAQFDTISTFVNTTMPDLL
ncbi:phage tail protein, partial [Sorlinia euscelidii]